MRQDVDWLSGQDPAITHNDPNRTVGGRIVGNFHAQGAGFVRDGLSIVGEYGPEAVRLPVGSKVYSNSQSKGMFGGGAGPTVNINVSGVFGTKTEVQGAVVAALEEYAGRGGQIHAARAMR